MDAKQLDHAELTRQTAARRTCRTTFRLTAPCHELIALMAEQLEVSEKDLLHLLAGGLEQFMTKTTSPKGTPTQSSSAVNAECTRKTYVVTSGFLDSLAQLSRANNLSRDECLNRVVLMYAALCVTGSRSRLERWKEGLQLFTHMLEQMPSTIQEIENLCEDVDWERDDGVSPWVWFSNHDEAVFPLTEHLHREERFLERVEHLLEEAGYGALVANPELQENTSESLEPNDSESREEVR